ncbi:MAG: hypothetical protein ACOVQ2_08780, partial [Flavobacterium sp.]
MKTIKTFCFLFLLLNYSVYGQKKNNSIDNKQVSKSGLNLDVKNEQNNKKIVQDKSLTKLDT